MMTSTLNVIYKPTVNTHMVSYQAPYTSWTHLFPVPEGTDTHQLNSMPRLQEL